MYNPLVSIITIVYNDANNIEKTILSVLEQTYHKIQYLIIDGGSTDGTLQIIEKYRSKIGYFLSESDAGISDAFNKGINLAEGKLIGTINSGDFYEANAIELAVRMSKDFLKDDNIVLHGNIKMFGENWEKIYKPFNLSSFYRQMPVWHPTLFISKELYNKFRYNTSYKIAMDYELLSRIYSERKSKFIYIDATLSSMDTKGLSNHSAIKGFEEVMHASRKNLGVSKLKSYIIFKLRSIFYYLIHLRQKNV